MAISVAMAPGTSIILEIPSGMASGGVWSTYDDQAGQLTLITDRKQRYTHGNKVGIQKVTYSTQNEYCVINIIVMLPHDHSDIYRGGPAYGVYKS